MPSSILYGWSRSLSSFMVGGRVSSTSDEPVASGAAPASMDALEARLVRWAKSRRDIRTVLVVGSRAREERPADEWSDLDVAFTTTSRASYLTSTEWISDLGDVWVAYADQEGVTRHVLFAGGLDAGIAPLPHVALRTLLYVQRVRARFPRLWQVVPGPARAAVDGHIDELSAYCHRGVRLLLDKDGLGASLLAALPRDAVPAPLPTAEQFRAVVNEFWFLAVWNVKHLRRGELWAAKTVACDGRMKTLLLRMIEWHTRATKGADYDTWENGRHLEQWADPEVIDALRATFGHYDNEDLWRASTATTALFRALAAETAGLLDLPDPTSTDTQIADWITACQEHR
jgi:aminoglycoside 6-adenylyltransferase